MGRLRQVTSRTTRTRLPSHLRQDEEVTTTEPQQHLSTTISIKKYNFHSAGCYLIGCNKYTSGPGDLYQTKMMLLVI